MERDEITSALKYRVYYENDFIVKKGDIADSFFIIKSGKVACVDNNRLLCCFSAGQAFGEAALFQEGTRQVDVIAYSDKVECLQLSRQKLQNIIGDRDIKDLIMDSYLQWAFENDVVFQKFSPDLANIIMRKLTFESFSKGSILKKADRELKKILICVDGSIGIKLGNRSEEIQFHKGTCLGTQVLLGSVVGSNEAIKAENEETQIGGIAAKELYGAEISMKQEGSIYWMLMCDLKELSKFELKEVIYMVQHNLKTGEKTCRVGSKNATHNELGSITRKKIRKNKLNITGQFLDFKKFLGQGLLGSFYLATDLSRNSLYAVKVIPLSKLDEVNAFDYPMVKLKYNTFLCHLFLVGLV